MFSFIKRVVVHLSKLKKEKTNKSKEETSFIFDFVSPLLEDDLSVVVKSKKKTREQWSYRDSLFVRGTGDTITVSSVPSRFRL